MSLKDGLKKHSRRFIVGKKNPCQQKLTQVSKGFRHRYHQTGGCLIVVLSLDEPLVYSDLKGVEGPGHSGEFEKNLHGGEDDGGQRDVEAAEPKIPFHIGASSLDMVR